MAETIKHVVLARFKDEVTEEERQKYIEEYAALPSKISEMKGFEWGTDVSIENAHEEYTHIFITTFDSKEGRDIYVYHETHTEYANRLLSKVAKVLVIDFAPIVVVRSSV